MKARLDTARLRVGALTVSAVIAAALGACAPTQSPSINPKASLGPPVLGVDWGRAASVERPVNFDATMPPGDVRTHPILRIPGQAIMADVIPLPVGGFAAMGYVPPRWQPASWTSADGSNWSFHPLEPTDFTFPVALAAGGGGTLVAVGRSGKLPAAWTSRDGTTWQQHPVPVAGEVAERMTSVVAGDQGFVAGGSVGPELFDRHARFWTSADGSSWTAVPDDAAAFANAEVRAIARFEGGFVAVGVEGAAQAPTGAVAWTSPDGSTWTRIDAAAFEGGVAVAVTEAPSGGLVAVGSNVDRTEAVAWTSADGRTWARAPKEASRLYPGYGKSAGFVWMTDVAVIGDKIVGIGTYQGLQRGTATSWVSHDGLHWDQARTSPVQEQGEFYAITAGGPGAIVVGSFGAPDSYVPTVWLSPSH